MSQPYKVIQPSETGRSHMKLFGGTSVLLDARRDREDSDGEAGFFRRVVSFG
ncbi:hypothetical protein ACF1AX_21515 [Streptomyces sp. NPDC014802]|uniref:hypothetical protein n=1 Tax=Streptomyces sp. NPDC014802 TaxID=3364917 RepID=UPI0036F87A20